MPQVERGRVEELRTGRYGKVRTVILRTQDGGRLVRPVQLVTPWRLTRVGRVWRTSNYNLCILLVEVGSSGNKDGGK